MQGDDYRSLIENGSLGRRLRCRRKDGSGHLSGKAHVNVAGYELTDGEDETNANAADKDSKPVFLKGLFRYVPDSPPRYAR